MPSKKVQARPDAVDPANELRPYQFHGMMISDEDGEHPYAECPFCGKEKFSVTVGKGTWGCWSCGEKGNVYTFLRRLWEESDKATNGASKRFAEERGLLDSSTLNVWGIVQSVLDGSWLVPGWNREGKLTQLYKRVKVGVKGGKPRWELRPTPTLGHALHGVQLWDKAKPTVHLHESWGNALAFWEVLRQARTTEEGLRVTAAESSSLYASANVLAVANCGAVGQPLGPFLGLFNGKRVVLWFDNDHPRVNDKTGQAVEGAGRLASERAARLIATASPLSIHWMPWPGREGLPDGYDVRDVLTGSLDERVAKLQWLLNSIEAVPEEWVAAARLQSTIREGQQLGPLPCRSWRELTNCWKKAFHWRKDIEDVLAVMMAVALSTSQRGNQLFLQVIGDAGSGKTELCEGMLISKQCFNLEQISSFTSGWKDKDGDDVSLLAQMNHRTLVTPEADVMMSNPKYTQIMSQCRRIFDGSFTARYGNRKDAMSYPDLRTPWIQAGTPALLDCDQSRLGDRFLKVFIEPPSEDDRREIIRKAIYTEGNALLQTANGDGQGTAAPAMMTARRMTAGFVEHLRVNAEELLAKVHTEDDTMMDKIVHLAEFTAFLRARPHPDKNKLERHDTKELPTRLGKQFRRLASCVAAVLGREIDGVVLGVVRKVAMDTSRGVARNLAWAMHKAGRDGAVLAVVAHNANMTDAVAKDMLNFMAGIGAAVKDKRRAGGSCRTKWRLSDRMWELWEEVNGV